MATHIKRFSDSPCSNKCTEMSEEVEISFQCLCCKINNDKNLENLVDFDTVEELCAHLAVTHLQNFIISDLKNSDTKNDKTKTCKFMNEKYLSLNMVTVEEQELHMKSHSVQSIEICPKCYQGPFGSQNELLSHIGFYHKEMVENWVGKLNPKLNKTLEPIQKVG